MQNNKPTEVVYDASNCLVLPYTVNNLLYGQREEIRKIFTSGRKYSQCGKKSSSIEEKNLSWASNACVTSSDQSWTDHAGASIAPEMCKIQ